MKEGEEFQLGKSGNEDGLMPGVQIGVNVTAIIL